MKPRTPPPPDCIHPTRTVVIVDILLRTRAAMHTTIAAAAVWQFEATQNRFLLKVFRIGTVRYVCACVTGLQHTALYRLGRFALLALKFI